MNWLKRLKLPRNLNSVKDVQRNSAALLELLPLLRLIVSEPLNVSNIHDLRVRLKALGLL